MRFSVANALVALLAASACRGTSGAAPDLDAGPPPTVDARARDAPMRADVRDAPETPAPRRGSLGALCDEGACDPGLSCGTDVVVTIVELDGGTRALTIAQGLCTRRCALEALGTCGETTACSASVLLGAGRVSLLDDARNGYCLPVLFADDASLWHPLNPSEAGRPPVPCSTPAGAEVVRPECLLRCRADADCFYEPVSARPPVFREIAPTPAIDCDVVDGACRHWSSTGPSLGSPCTSDLGCVAEHICWGGADWSTPGVCVAPGCELCDGTGLECVELEPGARGCARTAP